LKDELVAEKRKRVEAERKASRALERVSESASLLSLLLLTGDWESSSADRAGVMVDDLENKLKSARNAVEQANKSKEDAAREIVEDAKMRMEAMHNDVSFLRSLLLCAL